MELNFDKLKQHNYFSKLSYNDLIIFLIPVILFSVYLYVFYPGILRYDSFNQLHQIVAHEYYNWHPFFHTFIEKVLLKIYPSPVTVCVFQILTFSTIWTVICNYYRRDIENNKVFIIQVVLTVIIALIPINAIFSIMLVKDVLFSYWLLFLCFLVAVIVDREDIGYEFIFLIALTMGCLSQIRPNGIYIIVLTLIFLGYYLFKRNLTKKFLTILALTFVIILLIASLNVVFDVHDNQKSAVLAKVSHMLADYDLNLDLDEPDRQKIHELVSEKDIREKYRTTFSDPICFASNKSVWDNYSHDYIEMAVKYSIKNPIHFLEYLFNSAPIVWDITRDSSWIGYQYNTDMEKDKYKFYSNHKEINITEFEDISYKNNGTGMFVGLNNFVNDFKDNIILDTLFDSPALYMYISLLLLAVMFFITRSKAIFLIYLPNLLNILVIFVSTPIQDNRYLYPNLLVCYFLIIMLIYVLAKKHSSESAE
ncbi:hypothetical protein [Methanobrevibacter sp.]|uniref:hypothetical protein n=1 Tax=Methanobrevibacter sp. TaxID=66852 RepID=UPI00388E7214